jgi:urocanate hydratase
LRPNINHAQPKEEILTVDEKISLTHALRYFDTKDHAVLLPEFKAELDTYGRIYMYRLRPDYEMRASIAEYPGNASKPKPLC